VVIFASDSPCRDAEGVVAGALVDGGDFSVTGDEMHSWV